MSPARSTWRCSLFRLARRAGADRGRREEDPGAVLIPSGSPRPATSRSEAPRKSGIARRAPDGPQHLRLLLHAENLCATPRRTTSREPRRRRSPAASAWRSSAFAPAKMGVSAIGLATSRTSTTIADVLRAGRQHADHRAALRDLKDGRAFAEVAKRAEKEAHRYAEGGRLLAMPSSHTGALTGNDKIYEDAAAVRRPRARLRDLLEFAGIRPADAQGRNADHHGAAAQGCPVRRVSTMTVADGDATRSRRRIPQVHSPLALPATGRHHRRRAAQDVSKYVA